MQVTIASLFCERIKIGGSNGDSDTRIVVDARYVCLTVAIRAYLITAFESRQECPLT